MTWGQGKTLMGKKNSSKSENTLWSQVTEILEYTYNTIVFKQVAKFSNLDISFALALYSLPSFFS